MRIPAIWMLFQIASQTSKSNESRESLDEYQWHFTLCQPNVFWCEFPIGLRRIHIENQISIKKFVPILYVRCVGHLVISCNIDWLDENKRKQSEKMPAPDPFLGDAAKRTFTPLNDYHFRWLLFSSLLLLLFHVVAALISFRWFSVCMKIMGPVRCIANQFDCERLEKGLLCWFCQTIYFVLHMQLG